MPKPLSPEHNVLRILLKEVLQQTPRAQAIELAKAHKEGKILRLAIGDNSRGIDCMCAFQWGISRDARLEQTKGNA
jgi:hypothetical protein